MVFSSSTDYDKRCQTCRACLEASGEYSLLRSCLVTKVGPSRNPSDCSSRRQHLYQQDMGGCYKGTRCAEHQGHGSRVFIPDALQLVCITSTMGGVEEFLISIVRILSRRSAAKKHLKESVPVQYSSFSTCLYSRDISVFLRATTIHAHAELAVQVAVSTPF